MVVACEQEDVYNCEGAIWGSVQAEKMGGQGPGNWNAVSLLWHSLSFHFPVGNRRHIQNRIALGALLLFSG